jgi:hypothetical protein
MNFIYLDAIRDCPGLTEVLSQGNVNPTTIRGFQYCALLSPMVNGEWLMVHDDWLIIHGL